MMKTWMTKRRIYRLMTAKKRMRKLRTEKKNSENNNRPKGLAKRPQKKDQ